MQRHDPPPRLPPSIALLAFAGAVAALAGGYWDDAWHTEEGRDEFFIAPHLAIYLGVATAGGALSLWALVVARSRRLPAVWSHRPLALGLLAVAVTLASGPIDNVWHVAFGRDAVIWSPPHMLGIAGTLALGAALLAEFTGRPESWAGPMGVFAAALVLAAAAFTAVEYETDVPQFDAAFHLPVLGFAVAVAMTLIRSADDHRWAAVRATALYTVFTLLVGGFLLALDFPPPALPLLLPAALAVDLADRRMLGPPASAALFTAALYLAYVPVRNLLGEGVRYDEADVALGIGMTFAATLTVFAVARPAAAGHRRLGGGGAAAAVALVGAVAFLAAPSPASAHDPGQGEEAGTMALRVAAEEDRVVLSARLRRAVCERTTPVALVARRAGSELRAPLEKRGCRLSGVLTVSERGRWFVYAETLRDGRPVEAWLPIVVGYGNTEIAEADRYAYTPPAGSGGAAKVVAGAIVYAGVLALLCATFLLVGAGSRPRPSA